MTSSFWANKKVLLTGHTGFKGSWLSLWLQLLGARVIGFSKSIPTNPSLFELADVSSKMVSIFGDVRDFDSLKHVIEHNMPQVIIHMAAQSLVHRSYLDPRETYSTNVMGTVNLFEAVRVTKITPVIINVTSDKCYASKEDGIPFSEDDPLGGYDPYSNSKSCAELVTSSFRNSFFNSEGSNVPVASVRAGNVIGGGDWSEDRLIPDIIRAITKNQPLTIRHPNAIRPWQFVLEPLRGYLMLAEKLSENGMEFAGAYNFGPKEDQTKTVSFVVERFCRLCQVNIKIDSQPSSFYESAQLQLDCTKAKTKLNWFPKIDIDTALELTANWYKQYFEGKKMRDVTEEQISQYTSM